MQLRLLISILTFIFLLQSTPGIGQQDLVKANFIEYPNQRFGFDSYQYAALKSQYEAFNLKNKRYWIAYKSVVANSEDSVRLVLSDTDKNRYRLTLKIADSTIGQIRVRSKDTVSVLLPAMDHSYDLDVFDGNTRIGRLSISVYPVQDVSVVIVPMTSCAINDDSLKRYLDNVYAQAGIKFSLHVAPISSDNSIVHEELDNPSKHHDRYTDQMIDIREKYFEHHEPTGSYYIFLVDGFTDQKLKGYMVRNKGLAFIKYTETDLYREIAHQLGYGIGGLNDLWIDKGPKKGSTMNLMDLGDGTHLTWSQWESIRFNYGIITYYDDYEDVRTNNGLIAYYVWEENDEGFIKNTYQGLFNGIHRPFKRNHFGRHLNINNWFFAPLISIKGVNICLLHLILFIALIILSILSRKTFIRKLKQWIGNYWLLRMIGRLANFVVFIYLGYLTFHLVNKGYLFFEVKSGVLSYMNKYSVNDVIRQVRTERNPDKIEEENLGSEVLIRKGDDWFLERTSNVLYFDVFKDGSDWRKCRFTGGSDSLIVNTHGYQGIAQSHYMVFNYRDTTDHIVYQKVFNHLGKEITDKLKLDDPAKRILLFVNGYRPTSIGRTFEENFFDVQKHGLEFPNSSNIVYAFDRYNYWERWMQVNELFRKRINPDETFYADGHFSVATSNHGSLFNFSTLARIYPDRCEEGEHTCQTTTALNWWLLGAPYKSKTADLLPHKPNEKGFNYRKRNGHVAGRNVEQILNEIPNRSQNDTLYIVAHSMGFAYAQGIVEQLRGKINFGGYYIISPENASTGIVKENEWQEIWQYGSHYALHYKNAPCLLDGIAPQVKVGGLSVNHRIYIPEEFYDKMGFYDSHFIGHYRWILDIPKDQSGYIRQR